jgi:hypothetical protein
MKRDSQGDELAEQWTLLPGERELSANKSGTTRRGFAVLLKFFRCEARFPQSPEEVPESRCQLGPYFTPDDTNVFARPSGPETSAN